MAASGAECSGGSSALECIDSTVAKQLKVGAIVAILVACVLGVCMPLLGQRFKTFKSDGNLFFVLKAFAAGVILATAFVHMLPDAFDSLTNACLPENPWSKFPFAGLIAMMAALATLFFDFAATAHFQNKHHHHAHVQHMDDQNLPVAAPTEDEQLKIRHRVVSQVLELGIVAHSVIIGITLGTSESPCTIRPLLAALTLHQFFEGIALGGCIAQAGYGMISASIMAFFFSITTPLGICIGIAITSTYNENSPKSLIIQGVFDSMSTGILIYMSLVDLIAADFLSGKLQRNKILQSFAFLSLFLGSGLMSLIAYWA